MSAFLRPVAVYLVAYVVASFLDLATTSLAVAQPGVREQNLFATSGHVYAAGRAWLITLAGGAMMAGCVAFAVAYARRVEGEWLLRPVHSFAAFYVNPWSKAAIGRSPLHLLSFAVAFVVLRLLAAGNNLLIAACGLAPIGIPIEWIGARTSALVGFAAVIIPLYYVLAMALSPLCARTIRAWRDSLGSGTLGTQPARRLATVLRWGFHTPGKDRLKNDDQARRGRGARSAPIDGCRPERADTGSRGRESGESAFRDRRKNDI